MSEAEQVELRCSTVVFRGGGVLLVRRSLDGSETWVLPGGTPRRGETMVACARRELHEETGLSAEPAYVLLVLEAIDADTRLHTVDMVFLAREYGPACRPQQLEPGLAPEFVQVDTLSALNLRPPIAGHLRSAAAGIHRSAPYLGNMWRPPGAASGHAATADDRGRRSFRLRGPDASS